MIDVDGAVTAAKAMKESDWEDLLPTLHIEFYDGPQAIIAMPDFGGGEQGAKMLAATLIQQRVMQGPIKNMVFYNDARMRSLEEGQERPPDDDLQRKWLAGDRDGIVEVVLVHHLDESGTYTHRCLPYDAESQTWLEAPNPEEAGGRIVDTLKLAGFSILPDGSRHTELDTHIHNLREQS